MQATSADANSAANSASVSPLRDVDDVGDTQLGDELLGGPVGFHLGDEPQLEIAAQAKFRDRMKQGADALEWGVRAGDGHHPAGFAG